MACITFVKKQITIISYREIAQLELMNALNSIKSEAELKEFRDMIMQFFAEKAQDETKAAIAEARNNKEKKVYDSVDELMCELMK